VSLPSVNTHHNWALGNEDSSAADSAPNMGSPTGNVLLEETGPNTSAVVVMRRSRTAS